MIPNKRERFMLFVKDYCIAIGILCMLCTFVLGLAVGYFAKMEDLSEAEKATVTASHEELKYEGYNFCPYCGAYLYYEPEEK